LNAAVERLAAAFLGELPAKHPARDTPAQVHERWLTSALEAGREKVPRARVDPALFARFLGQKVAAAEEAPETLCAHDLYLAHACLRGDAAALSELERQISRISAREAGKLRIESDGGEVAQRVLEQLLAPGKGKVAALSQYSGRGAIAQWLKVVIARELLRVRKAPAAATSTEGEDALADLVAPNSDPELGYLRENFRGHFRAAFAAALAGLSEKERRLIRQSFLEGLSIDALARQYEVHRATAARWVVSAREALADAVRAEIAARMRASPREVESLVKLVSSRLDLSLRRLTSSR
jgi:RNA polymerase sigma-70 factor, ECF subfamily